MSMVLPNRSDELPVLVRCMPCAVSHYKLCSPLGTDVGYMWTDSPANFVLFEHLYTTLIRSTVTPVFDGLSVLIFEKKPL